MFESLENRRMLSVTAKFDPGTATYRVEGDDAKQNIQVEIDRVAVESARSKTTTTYDRVRVFDNGQLAFTTLQPLDTMKAVDINTYGADDTVIATNNGTNARVRVNGGDGNDSIDVTSAAGAPGSTVRGGAGDDNLVVASKRSTAGHTVFGDRGNDAITGSDFADQLFGDDPSSDKVDDDGNDVIFGGAGNDILIGGGGNDYLDGQAGSDKVDGGEGLDTAVVDAEDEKPTNVEDVVSGESTGSDSL